MIGLFWNCGALGLPEKQRYLREIMLEHKLDFIGLQETMKQDCTVGFLNDISSGHDFCWHWAAARRRSGGILVGIKSSCFDMPDVSVREYCVRLLLLNKDNKFKWNLVVVYGAAQVDGKEKFLTELSCVCQNNIYPTMPGGDFNIIRYASEKNKPSGPTKWTFLFNAIIETFGLKELQLSSRKCTWCNNRDDPLLEKLDRVLVSTGREIQYPLVTVQALVRVLSDHSPLLLDTGHLSQTDST